MWLFEARAQHRQGGCWVLTNHPFISGRPGRAYALEQLIEGVKALDGMWVTTLADIADHAARTVSTIRTHERFSVPTFPDLPITMNGILVGSDLVNVDWSPDETARFASSGRGSRGT
jgi:hypothetical protein